MRIPFSGSDFTQSKTGFEVYKFSLWFLRFCATGLGVAHLGSMVLLYQVFSYGSVSC